MPNGYVVAEEGVWQSCTVCLPVSEILRGKKAVEIDTLEPLILGI